MLLHSSRMRLLPRKALPAIFLLAVALSVLVRPAQAQQPVVRGVMFWLEGCGHCEYVRNDVLPPLQAKYGEQLDILQLEIVTEEDVARLYTTAALFGMPKEEVGVPFLIVGDEVLTGSEEIPDRLPQLIEGHLAAGGLDFPRLSPLAEVLPTTAVEADAPATKTATAVAPSIPATPVAEVVMADEPEESALAPDGFVLAYIVLAAMILVVVYAAVTVLRGGRKTGPTPSWQSYAVLVLALLGLGVSIYMSYIETQHAEAVCGPVGDCNAVQSSPYARLFGIPIGILGVLGYLAILTVWLWQRLRHDRLAAWTPLLLFGMTFMGTLFSIYLTFLEPFVIRAVCMWCISQAVIMTLLLLLSVGPVVRALHIEPESELELDEVTG